MKSASRWFNYTEIVEGIVVILLLLVPEAIRMLNIVMKTFLED
jgi:hypothetical protein